MGVRGFVNGSRDRTGAVDAFGGSFLGRWSSEVPGTNQHNAAHSEKVRPPPVTQIDEASERVAPHPQAALPPPQ